jgi:predicted secreted acid phosphatase
VGRSSEPPSYPTAVAVTPGIAAKAASTPQKHPAPNVAFSVLILIMMQETGLRCQETGSGVRVQVSGSNYNPRNDRWDSWVPEKDSEKLRGSVYFAET